nr:RNA polymerase sigma factor [uncultured Holophaga sp.]
MDPVGETLARELGRLKGFIRSRVWQESDAEDIVQEVLYEFVRAQEAMEPIREAGAWLFQVARHRITDLFRRRSTEVRRLHIEEDEGDLSLEDWLPSPEAGPDALYARQLLLEELDQALDELPELQRQVFIAHAIEGHSFKELSEAWAVPINTLLSRKHNAVKFLRRRLEGIYQEYPHA